LSSDYLKYMYMELISADMFFLFDISCTGIVLGPEAESVLILILQLR